MKKIIASCGDVHLILERKIFSVQYLELLQERLTQQQAASAFGQLVILQAKKQGKL